MGIMFSPTVRKARWSGKYCVLYGTDGLEFWVDKITLLINPAEQFRLILLEGGIIDKSSY
jgi:hypothetical protein